MIPLLLFVAPAAAVTVELNPGDDIRSLTETLAAGDEFIFNDGTFQITNTLNWTGLGTESDPIVFRAAEGASPVIELLPQEGGEDHAGNIVYLYESTFVEIEGLSLRGDEGWLDPDDKFIGLRIDTCSDITVSDVEIAQTGNAALYLPGTNARITMSDLYIHDVLDSTAVYVGCSDASCFTTESSLTNSWIHGISGSGSYGVYLAHGSQGWSVTDNVIYDIEKTGVYLGSTEYGETNKLEGNAIWALGETGIRVQGSALIRNNVVFNAGQEGIHTSDPERETWTDVIISYNTVADTGEWAAELDDWPLGSGMVLSSNSLCNPTGYGLELDLEEGDTGVEPHGAMISHNVVCGLVTGIDLFSSEVMAGAGTTDFSDAAAWDFYPTDGSILIDAGDPASEAWIPETDFNGFPRDGGAPDAGAYEFSGEGNPGWALQEGFKEFADSRPVSEETVGGCCKDKGGDGAAKGEAAAAALFGLVALGWRRRRG